jgi:hypothetical protein
MTWKSLNETALRAVAVSARSLLVSDEGLHVRGLVAHEPI